MMSWLQGCQSWKCIAEETARTVIILCEAYVCCCVQNLVTFTGWLQMPPFTNPAPALNRFPHCFYIFMASNSFMLLESTVHGY